MDRSFTQWRSSSNDRKNDRSFVVSDSDEDVIGSSIKDPLFIDESYDDIDISENTSEKETTKERKLNTTNESNNESTNESTNETLSDNTHSSSETDSDEQSQASDVKKIPYKELILISDSGSDSEKNSESELAISLAKEEIGVGNIDPLVAQKRAFIVCKMQQLEHQLAKTKMLLNTGNMEALPDKGLKLRQNILEQEKEIEKLTIELKNMPLIQDLNIKESCEQKELLEQNGSKPFIKNQSHSDKASCSYLDVDIPMRPKTSPESKLGKKAQATRDKELALTVERLQDLHGSLVARPSEDEKAQDPKGLKVQLLPHQQHALAWLLWREQQKPSGGVLADDMGLGKTLTMISLVMTTLARKDLYECDDSDDEWNNKSKPLHCKGGTLVVCPASLLSQWEKEVQNRCKRGLLSVEVYHGNRRETVPKRLARNNMVITTYNLLSQEFKKTSTLYKINWERVILDEAHIVRNHKSQASQAVCGLTANKRWALTGTPIQNKAMDLYPILKFLKCSPFNELYMWKRWVDNKNAAGIQRLATILKTIMLRRTKEELQAKGALDSLPEKSIEEVMVTLDSQEKLVYEKILIYSRTLFAQFLAQRAEKDHIRDLSSGIYDKPTFLSNPNKQTQFTKAQNKLLAMHADVKTHEIFVLLLRLRQVCCHPPLINTMLDQEDMKQSGMIETENVDPELLSKIQNMSLYNIENEDLEDEDIGIDREIVNDVLSSENPVFDEKRVSSKMKVLLNLVKEILQKDDKLIIVSQWTSMLNAIASHLPSIKGATFSMFTGSVPIKNRQGIMDSFNSRNSGPKILLLSLTAGGVGLNLVGGNHLLLFDIHWNPQLETQAQDRIYRFGQKKDVFIYKFICSNTIEERIKMLQDRKLNIAQNVLSGDKNSAITKLSLNDLKLLFAL